MLEDQTALAENLKMLMTARGISMRALSIGSGQEESTVKRIVNGRTQSPRTDTVRALADYFGVSVDDLMRRGAFEYTKGQLPPPRTFMPDGSAVSISLVETAAGNVLRDLADHGYLTIGKDEAAEIAKGIAAHAVELAALPPAERDLPEAERKAGFVKSMLQVLRLRTGTFARVE